MKVPPWHSKRDPHYHNNNGCTRGTAILPHHREAGTGGKPLCKDCAKLNAVGK